MNSVLRNPWLRYAGIALCGTFLLAAGSATFNREAVAQTPEEQPAPVVTHTAVIKTSMGDIEIELYGKDAPKTVANFVGLAKQNAYDSVLFHRIVPDFVVQAGDPKTKDAKLQGQWGTGGTSIYDGKEFEDELDPATPSYKQGYQEGVLAMANRGPNTNTSQFFIICGPRGTSLPHLYTIFGKVTTGMNIVYAMEDVPLNGSVPATPIRILDVTAKEVKGSK